MGKLNRIVPALCALLGACHAAPVEPQSDPQRPDRQRARAALQTAAPDPRLDANGALKGSYARMSWLEIPAGFTLRPGSTARVAWYDAEGLPLIKVREYLQARVRSDQVEYRKNGVLFHEALPTHTQLTMPPVNVTLLELNPVTHALRLTVEDLTPPATQPLSEAKAAQELARARSREE